MDEQYDPKVNTMEDVEIMDSLGVNMMDLVDPLSSRRMAEIVDFFKGKEDKNYMLTKLSSQTDKDNIIEHTYRFVALRKEVDSTAKKLQELDKELSLYD